MPGGLRDVEQKFDADASGYIAGISRMIEENRGFIRSLQEVTRQNEEMVRALGGGSDDIGAVNRAIRENLDSIREYGPLIAEATARNREFNAAQRESAAAQAETTRLTQEGRQALQNLGEAYGLVRDKATASQKDIAAGHIAEMSHLDQMVVKLGVAKEAYASLGDASAPLAYTADSAKTLNAILDNTRVSADGATRALGGLAAQRALVAAAGGGGGISAGAAALLGGGGGGGGGTFAPGTAGADANAIIAFAKQWGPAVHYISMGVAELAATVIPAAAALGGATAVAYQGIEHMISRGQAIYSTAEALGPAYGVSAGQLIAGPGGGALQRYQNLGEGGAYGIAGAGIQLLQGGAATGFLGQGLSALSMLDRGAASAVLNAQGPGGTAAKLSGALGGGVGYLKQFGDVGANLGDFLLNMAPNLPGVGQMWLGGLDSASIGLRNLSSLGRFPLGGMAIGGGMAAEAGWRLGKPLLGLLGKGATGLGGLAESLGLGSLAGEGAGTGLAGGLEGLGLGLGSLTGAPVAGVAASAYLLRALVSSMPSSTARQISGLQGSLYGQGFSSQFAPLAQAIQKATGLAAPPGTAGGMMQQVLGSGATGEEVGRFGYTTAAGIAGGTPSQNWAAAATGFGQTMGNLIRSGPQLVSILKGMGLQGVTTAQGFQVAQNALLNLGTAFDSSGKLSKVAQQQIKDYTSALGPMGSRVAQNVPALQSAIGAGTIMNSSQIKDLANVNSSLDSLTQMMTGGPLGAAAQMGAISAMGPAHPAAKALTSFFSPAGGAAWSAFTGTANAPGVISTMQQNMDQLRTYLSLGALSGGQATGLAARYVQGALPYAAQSPAALAMLQQQGMQLGVPGLAMGESYKQTADAINKSADNVKAANAAMTQAVQKSANIPQVAQQFMQGMQPALSTAAATRAAQDALGVAVGGKGEAGALSDYVGVLKAMGVTSRAGVSANLGSVFAGGKLPSNVQMQIDEIIKPPKMPALPKPPPVDYTTKVTPPTLPPPPKGSPITFPTHVSPPLVPPAPKGSPVVYPSLVTKPVAPPAPRGGVVVYTSTVIGPGLSQAAINAAGTASVAGSPARMHGQSGFRVPGTGSGDTFPAMLEPGELVVPKGMVSAGAVDHLRGSIPGFAGGGIAGVNVPDVTGLGMPMRIAMQSGFNQMTSGLNSYLGGLMQPYGGGGGSYRQGLPISQAVPVRVVGTSGGTGFSIPGHVPLPPAASKVIDSFEETFKKMKSPWGKLSSDILSEMLAGIKDGKKETAAMAKALVGQVSSEIGSLKGMGSPWAGIAAQIMSGMLDGIKGNKGETAKMAQAMFDQVTKEVNYMRTVAGATNAISQWGNFGGGLATPTTTAQGQNYQYYTDQQAIAGGGTVSVQQNMGDYLQAMKSFQGDIGKLSKGGINKQMLQQIIGQGPLQGDQEAQSILGGTGGVKGANQLWNQINAMSKSLGITAGQDVYGFGAGGAGGKNVKVGANVTGTPAVHALQAAISNLQGKTVTIKVNVVEAGGGSAGTFSKLNKTEIKAVTSQVQASLLQQARRNRRTGISLPGYGT